MGCSHSSSQNSKLSPHTKSVWQPPPHKYSHWSPFGRVKPCVSKCFWRSSTVAGIRISAKIEPSFFLVRRSLGLPSWKVSKVIWWLRGLAFQSSMDCWYCSLNVNSSKLTGWLHVKLIGSCSTSIGGITAWRRGVVRCFKISSVWNWPPQYCKISSSKAALNLGKSGCVVSEKPFQPKVTVSPGIKTKLRSFRV